MLLAVFLVSFPIVVIGFGVLLGLTARQLTRRKGRLATERVGSDVSVSVRA